MNNAPEGWRRQAWAGAWLGWGAWRGLVRYVGRRVVSEGPRGGCRVVGGGCRVVGGGRRKVGGGVRGGVRPGGRRRRSPRRCRRGNTSRRCSRSSARKDAVPSSPRTRKTEWLPMLARCVSRGTLRVQRTWWCVMSGTVVAPAKAVSARAEVPPFLPTASPPKYRAMRRSWAAIQGRRGRRCSTRGRGRRPGAGRASPPGGPGGLRPVPGLGVRHEVGGGVGEGEGVAVAAYEGDVGEGAAELAGHAVAGFDRDDVRAAGVQEGGRDAGACAHVDRRAPVRGRPAALSIASKRAGG